MSTKTSIEWTATIHPDGTVTPGKTWNPTTGCDKVSPGCAHCYAEGIAERFWAKQYPSITVATPDGFDLERRPRRFTDVMTHDDRLLEPLSWRRPQRIFVNSMSDLFHEDIDPLFVGRVFNVMGQASQHTFQVLTKRPARMLDLVSDYYRAIRSEPYRNIWLGVSVENQHFADERIPLLLQTPAAVRFISAEPLLGPVDLHLGVPSREVRVDNPAPRAIGSQGGAATPGERESVDVGNVAKPRPQPGQCTRAEARHSNLDWVIVGGESGPGARPFDLAWARSIVSQCQAAGVPVFVKQLGAKPMHYSIGDTGSYPITNRKGGDPAEWPADLQVRQFPELR